MSNQYNEYFTFASIKSDTHGVWISGVNTFAAPERDVEMVTIPGRNGLLTLDNGRYQNIKITYPCFMPTDNFHTNFDAFKAAMLAKVGYFELSDTYHTDGFRMARIMNGITPKTGIANKTASFDITFDCYPQFYLTTGQSYSTVTSGATFNNPTAFPSKPLIQMSFSGTPRSGTVTVGGKTITVTAADASPIYIDCELQHAYYVSSNVKYSQDSKITLTSGDFPELPAGNSTISYTGASQVKIMPRWWRL